MTTQTIEAPKSNGAAKAAPLPTATSDYLPIDKIGPSPMNPRKVIGDLAELAAALQEKGLLVPILVRPSPKKGAPYEIVFGERRWRALKSIGETVVRCEVRELTDDQALELMLVEYVQRVDLAPLEEAAAFASLRDKLKLDEKGIAKLVKKTPAYVFKQLRLDMLSPAAKAALTAGDLLVGAARQLALVGNHAAQDELLTRLIRKVEHGYEHAPSTERQAKEIVIGSLRKLKDAPFNIGKTPFVIIGDVDAGACTVCPKNTGAQLVLLGEAASDDERCTDAACWKSKVSVHGEAVLEDAKKMGMPIVKDAAIWDTYGRLKHDAPYVDLAEQSSDGKWKKVLEGSGLKEYVSLDNDGKPHTIADKKGAETWAKKQRAKDSAGSFASGGPKASSGTKRVVDESEKIQEAQERALFAAVAAKGEKASPAAILRLVVHAFAGMNGDKVGDIIERRGVKAPKGALNALEELVSKADIVKLCGLTAEFLVADTYNRDDVCEALKLDVDAIEQKAADAFKAGAKLEDAKRAPPSPAKPTKKAKAKKGGKKK